MSVERGLIKTSPSAIGSAIGSAQLAENPRRGEKSIRLAGLLVLLTMGATSAMADDVAYAWRFDDSADGPFLLLGSAEATDDFVFLLSCSDDQSTSDMVVYDIGGAHIGQPVRIELSRDGAKVSLEAITTADKRGFVFAEAKNFPLRPLISVLDGEGPVRMIAGKTITLLPDEGRAAKLAEFSARCSPN